MIVSRVIRDRCRKSRALRLALLKSCVKQTANHRFMVFATFAKKLPRKVGAASLRLYRQTSLSQASDQSQLLYYTTFRSIRIATKFGPVTVTQLTSLWFMWNHCMPWERNGFQVKYPLTGSLNHTGEIAYSTYYGPKKTFERNWCLKSSDRFNLKYEEILLKHSQHPVTDIPSPNKDVFDVLAWGRSCTVH